MRKVLNLLSTFVLILFTQIGGTSHASEQLEMKKLKWSFEGVLGYYDRASLRRGFQVYNEVCSSCHSMNLLTYRKLLDIGFSQKEVKKIASEKMIQDGPNDQGEMFERPARASDRFKAPFPNKKAAEAANGGAYPPDFSLATKKYEHDGGANYMYSVVTGYGEQPPNSFVLPEGKYYNKYFAGHVIAMPPPLTGDGLVVFADGTEATVDQMARDVANFFQWASEPELEIRKKTGLKFMIFLSFATIICYIIKRKVWSSVR